MTSHNCWQSLKTRYEPDSNYRSIWLQNGRTVRFAVDPSKPIADLKYPEFYDIKITNTCSGKCPWCYQNSIPSDQTMYGNVVEKLRVFLSSIPINHRPYQIAYGGGEPTESEYFDDVIRMTAEEFAICPNFTTNGQMVNRSNLDDHLRLVKQYCGGVAVSTHKHLQHQWKLAVQAYASAGIRTNLHVIVSDAASIDGLLNAIDEFGDIVEYFVLLPYTNVGRAKGANKTVDWTYLTKNFPIDPSTKKKIAFGAMFYPWLKQRELDIEVSLYEPDLMSKYLDLRETGYLYPSSFSDRVLAKGFLEIRV